MPNSLISLFHLLPALSPVMALIAVLALVAYLLASRVITCEIGPFKATFK